MPALWLRGAGSPRPGQAASASVALTGRHGRLPRLRPRFRLGRTVRMRSASAEASGARRHRPWLTRTPRCGLRTSPLCTVPCVLRRRAATARGWGASCAPGSGMALAPAPATLVLPDHIGQCTLVPTTCRTHPCTLAPWHHRSSSSRSRSTETLPPRGAMARAVLTTYVPEPRRLGTVGARCGAGYGNQPSCVRTKGAGQLAPGAHALYVRRVRVPASGVPHVPRRAVA